MTNLFVSSLCIRFFMVLLNAQQNLFYFILVHIVHKSYTVFNILEV